MSQHSYQHTITVDASPAAAYRALTTGYDHWWTATQGQSFNHVGDRIKFSFAPNVSFWTLEAQELIPNTMVALACVEAHHIIVDKPNAPSTEWLGTTMIWHIEANGEQTHIHFIHSGLTPKLHCYDVCKAGWDTFFIDSLAAYLNTGTGSPHKAVITS